MRDVAKRRGTAELRRIARDMQAPLTARSAGADSPLGIAPKEIGCRHCRAQFACLSVGYCKLEKARDLVRERQQLTLFDERATAPVRDRT